jgi:hypothetical protein
LGVVGWGAILARILELPLFVSIPWFAIAAFVSTAILVVVVAQYLSETRAGERTDSFESLIE